MIRVLMLGRLGNNLFQYAIGRVLAEKHQVPLTMDASWFNEKGWSDVSCITRLPIKANIVRPFSLGSRLLKKITGKHHWEYLCKTQFRENLANHQYDSSFKKAPSDCLLVGYFQSPLYFHEIENQLRQELDLTAAFDRLPHPELSAKISTTNSVAVHVRRTDFTTLPVFQVCDLNYYKQTMDHLRQRLTSAHFYIFSDDPAWCKSNFTAHDESVVDYANHFDDPLIDLYLMSLARHHIIANSSYSWWAAWLGKKENQIVICPPRWFNGGANVPMTEKTIPGWEIFTPT